MSQATILTTGSEPLDRELADLRKRIDQLDRRLREATPSTSAQQIVQNINATEWVKTLFDHYADANNGTTVETDLYSDTIPANRLGADGDKLVAQYGGIFTGSGVSTQQLKAYFGGTAIYDSGALTIGGATQNWFLYAIIIRESLAVVRCSVAALSDFATIIPLTTYTRITGLTLNGTNILKITGTAAGVGAASNQITAKEGYVQWVKRA